MTAPDKPIFAYTGHPLVDVGACVIAAFNKRKSVEDVTEGDLDAIRGYIRRHYIAYCGHARSNKAVAAQKPFTSYLSVVFTQNSPFIAPTTRDDKRKAHTDAILGNAKATSDATEHCVFCGRAARRWYRQHIPLIQGETNINFTPGGLPGLAVCARCLLAICACPLGTLRSQGRMLLVHSGSQRLTMRLVYGFLHANMRLLSLPGAGKANQGASFPRTVLLDALEKASADKQDVAVRDAPASVTAYHMTNYGTSADVTLYYLPSELLRFVQLVRMHPATRQGWEFARQRGWKMGLPRKAGKEVEEPHEYVVGEHRNQLYEDLFDLPHNAPLFVRRHLHWRLSMFRKGDPGTDSVPDAWPLTELFLRMVLPMEPARVDVLRSLGERFANYVVDQNDKRFFDRLYRQSGGGWREYADFRNLLLRASHEEIRQQRPPLISFDEFLTAFEEGEEIARADWTLARDLLLIKMMDVLHERGWLKEHADELEAIPEETAEPESA